jgi:hypothetical protein
MYHQEQSMVKGYKTPMLLIEFDGDKVRPGWVYVSCTCAGISVMAVWVLCRGMQCQRDWVTVLFVTGLGASSGRLYHHHHQAVSMVKAYKTPMLLIEFDGDKVRWGLFPMQLRRCIPLQPLFGVCASTLYGLGPEAGGLGGCICVR